MGTTLTDNLTNMKKTRLLFFFLAAAALASCQKDPTEDTPAPVKAEFRGTAVFEAAGSSEEAFKVMWEPDVDRIGLFTVVDGRVEQTNIYYAAYSAVGGTTAFISPSPSKSIEWNTSVPACDVYAYYPYRVSYTDMTAIPVSVPSRQSGEAGGTAQIKKSLNLYAAAEGVPTTGETVDLDFTSVAGVVEVQLTSSVPIPAVQTLRLRADAGVALAYEEGTLDLTSGAVTLNPEVKPSNVVELALESPVMIYDTPVSFYLLVNRLAAGISLELEADYGTNVKTQSLGRLTVPETGLQGGMLTRYEVPFVYEGSEIESEDLNAQGTANTYLVTKPGTTYRFNAMIKGNGVARSFTWTETDGTQITRSYGQSDLSIVPADVRLLWYNTPKGADGWSHKCPIVETSVQYELGTVYFTTPDPFVAGNAVLAAFDAGGEILWSWNIWASEGYDPEASAVQTGRYRMMDRNLGAMAGPEAMNSADAREAALAVGNYYQWGRKDPFPAAVEYSDKGLDGTEMYWGLPTYTPIESLQQDCSAQSWGAADMMFGNNASDNSRPLGTVLGAGFTAEQGVAEAVRYPYRWISYTGSDCAGGLYHWMFDYNNLSSTEERGSWRCLWGAPTIGAVEANDNLKTIYDPCPVGWKVAPAEAYAYALNGLEKKTYGYLNTRNGLYFPWTGQRQAGFGGSQIRSLTNGTMFLSSACVAETTLQKGYENGITTGDTYTGAGYNVRCVKEEVGELTPSGNGPRCVLIGNSITRTWNTYDPDFFTANNLLAKGIDGQTSAQILERFFSDVVVNEPLCVQIECGTNDIADNDGAARTNEEILENVRTMAETAASKGIKVIIASVLPADDMWWKDNAWKEEFNPGVPQRILDLNEMLKAYAEEQGFSYADYHAVVRDENNALKEEYQVDAVHPNLAGFKVMEEVFLKVLEQTLHPNAATPGDGQIDDFDKEEWN